MLIIILLHFCVMMPFERLFIDLLELKLHDYLYRHT